jgi:hypothetical protein
MKKNCAQILFSNGSFIPKQKTVLIPAQVHSLYLSETLDSSAYCIDPYLNKIFGASAYSLELISIKRVVDVSAYPCASAQYFPKQSTRW